MAIIAAIRYIKIANSETPHFSEALRASGVDEDNAPICVCCGREVAKTVAFLDNGDNGLEAGWWGAACRWRALGVPKITPTALEKAAAMAEMRVIDALMSVWGAGTLRHASIVAVIETTTVEGPRSAVKTTAHITRSGFRPVRVTLGYFAGDARDAARRGGLNAIADAQAAIAMMALGDWTHPA